MLLTEEQLNQVETMAGLFFSPADILISLGFSPDDLDEFEIQIKVNPDSDIFKAYHKGRLTAEIELRMAIKQSALNGSTPAQNAMNEHFKNSIL